MNPFDYNILLYLSHFADHWPLLTKLITEIFSNELKTAIFAAAIWWAWFGPCERQQENREVISAGLLGSLASLAIVRLLMALLPFRARPLNNPLLGMTFPVTPVNWQAWNSFPSDHAAMFIMLAICLYRVSRTVGYFAFIDAIFFICIPRIFVGVHYPTDILGGAAIGVVVACLVLYKKCRDFLSRPMLRWMEVHAPSFYATAFMITFLIGTSFWPLTDLLNNARRLIDFL